MESPGLTWIPTGTPGRQPALPRHPRDRAPVVLRARRQRPGAPAVRRRGRGRLRGPLRPRPAAREPLPDRPARPDDLRLHRSCYYETIYIQGGNLLDDVRRRMGSTRFWTALRATSRQPVRARARTDAARRARRGDADRTSARRCSRRGSRGSTEGRQPRRSSRSRGPAAIRRRGPAASAGRRPAATGATPASPSTSQRDTRRSRGPHVRPYSSRTVGGSSPTRRPQGPVVDRAGQRQPGERPGQWRMEDGLGELARDGSRRAPVRPPRAIAATYASKASRSAAATRPARRTPARSAASPRSTGPAGRSPAVRATRRRRPSSSRRAWRGPTATAPGRVPCSPAR